MLDTDEMGVVLRLARNDEIDSEEFCRLSNSLYSRRVGPAYYRWQFFEAPFPTMLAFATTPEGSLAGCYGTQLKEVVGGKCKVGWALDIMVAPQFQGRGLFRPLAGFAFEQLAAYGPSAICVIANARAQGPHVKGLGWRLINGFRTFVCATGGSGVPAAGSGVEIQQVDRFEEAYLRPAEERISFPAEARTVATRRTPAYTDWRFVRCPRYRYQLFQVTRKSSPFGCLALKVFRDPLTGQLLGDIVDISWAEDDTEALTTMIRFALRHFRTQGVEQAAVWLQTNTILDEVGQGIGFRALEQTRYFCGKGLDAESGYFTDPRRWFLTMADSEVY